MNESGLPDIDIARWATCEREALHGPDSGRWGRVHVGALVAQAVRRELTGEEGAGNGELDLPCQTDEKTPRIADVPRQAALLVKEVRRLANEHAIRIDPGDDSPTGLWGAGVEGMIGLLSVRTGSHTDTAWLRLGQQLAGLEASGVEASPVDFGILVHVPRVRLDKPVAGALTSRPALALIGEWRVYEGRIHSVLLYGNSALPRPGRQCARCRIECGVRP